MTSLMRIASEVQLDIDRLKVALGPRLKVREIHFTNEKRREYLKALIETQLERQYDVDTAIGDVVLLGLPVVRNDKVNGKALLVELT